MSKVGNYLVYANDRECGVWTSTSPVSGYAEPVGDEEIN